jgi:predicted CXXCH cytochrome family protein
MRRRHAARALLLAAFVLAFAAGATSAAFASTDSTYTAWDPAAPNDSPATPHKGYATTTTKCAVCHAVHKAPAAGELLLRTDVADACIYCHIQTNVGVKVIYGGNVTWFRGPDNDHGHQAPAAKCIDCHSVHGANTFMGVNTSKILKVGPIQPEFVTDIAGGDAAKIVAGDPFEVWPPYWETDKVQEVAFCSQCHPYYSDASERTITAQVVQSDGTFALTSFRTHPIKRPGNETGDGYYDGFVAQGSTIPTSSEVAVRGPTGCSDQCHSNPGPAGPENSFPHYNAYTSRFLSGAPDASSGWDVVEDSSQDSACLMCHVWFAGDGGADEHGDSIGYDGGVGITY